MLPMMSMNISCAVSARSSWTRQVSATMLRKIILKTGNAAGSYRHRMPAFCFPHSMTATDLHSMLYYTRNPEVLQPALMEEVFGCQTPLSAKGQKETFQELVTETLGNACDYETVVSIHENLNEIIEEKKDQPEPPTLTKPEVKNLLAISGAPEEVLDHFEEQFDATAGNKTEFLATNLTSTKALEVKTPDVIVKVSPEKAALLETRVINGRSYLLIQIDDQVEVNGVPIRPVTFSEPDSESEE